MQGTAADIIKRAMITVQDWLLSTKPVARMIMQVHDELVFEVETDAVDAVRDKVVALMEDAADLDVALKVDAGAGSNWDEAH
jgi:DNA polymerase-1